MASLASTTFRSTARIAATQLRSAISTTCSPRSLSTSTAIWYSGAPDFSGDIETVGVVGLGSMGHGVAQLAAQSGFSVVVSDYNQEALDNGLNAIHKSLKFLASKKVQKGVIDEAAASASVDEVFGRISGNVDLTHVTNSADIIVEAIIEDLDVKLPFFNTLASTAKPTAILATNTSSYSVGEMAAVCQLPERVCGLHYFNPVQVMKLVEIISTEDTHPDVTASVVKFVEKTGKTAVHCGDTPGFIVNRLLVPYIGQAIALLARGDATAPDIDTGMMLGAGHPMGPITLADYVGLDVIISIMEGWISKYPDNPAYQNPEAMDLLREKVSAGHYGRKSGHGFYRWDGNKCLGL